MSSCPYCAPYPGEAGHPGARIGIFFSRFTSWLKPGGTWVERALHLDAATRVIESASIRILVAIGVLRPIEARATDARIPNRSMVIVQAARSRGIDIRVLALFGSRLTSHFVILTQQGMRFFDALPTLAGRPRIAYDDKKAFKEFLQARGFPVPQSFAEGNVKFPVVVKPRSGSLTKHTSVNITTSEGLREALRIARIITHEVIIEAYVPGNVYRVTLVGGRVAAACRREAPSVTGDGIKRVRDLIAEKNADPRRGDFKDRNVTLHRILLTADTDRALLKQEMHLDDIPAAGTRIILHEKALMGAGGDVHEVTTLMHPDNRALCERLAVAVDAPLLGIDMITRDIAHSYRDERLVILEANTVPYIDMHHYPVTGAVQDVAGAVLDEYLRSV